jgi:DUF2075 family protein
MDEAHRIREKTGWPFKSTGRLQIEDLIWATRVSVFFVDDLQVVRDNEIGEASYIREQCDRLGLEMFEFDLEHQFRCSGSDGFINWVDHTLRIRKTANPEWQGDENFEVKIFDTPQELEEAIRAKNKDENITARMTAGFCWPWTHDPKEDGSLVNDVVIEEEDYERPWNAHKNATGLKKEIPKASFWAHDPNGINQIGCIYTAQGFEFDYAGVIFGKDLRYDFEENKWKGYPDESYDNSIKSSDDFLDLVKNTYRVLMTRARKGCYLYFEDEDTQKYFQSRISYEN